MVILGAGAVMKVEGWLVVGWGNSGSSKLSPHRSELKRTVNGLVEGKAIAIETEVENLLAQNVLSVKLSFLLVQCIIQLFYCTLGELFCNCCH